MIKIILAIFLLVIPSLCFAQDAAILIDKGYIKVAGGCYVFLKGEITFEPQNGNIKVVVDNSEGYFLDDKSQPIKSYETTLANIKAGEFFVRLKKLLASPQLSKGATTRAAVVEIKLPLQSETIHTEWKEIIGEFAIDPLLDEIAKFALENIPKR